MFASLRRTMLPFTLLTLLCTGLSGCFVYPYGDDGYRHDHHHHDDDHGDRGRDDYDNRQAR
jgi:hypothetical protein